MACPVCGGKLYLRPWTFPEGVGQTRAMVDCGSLHHARTDPYEWETRRLAARIDEIHTYLREHPSPA